MFRNRNNSQKPNDELLAAFKQTFPGIPQHGPASTAKEVTTAPGQPDSMTSSAAAAAVAAAAEASLLVPGSRQDISYMISYGSAVNSYDSEQQHHHHEQHSGNDGAVGDMTPSRFTMDQWRLTPSLFDPNAFPIGQMGNAQLGYYTPTPGGANTVYHNQAAGDLHTPAAPFQLGTPLSMAIPENSLHPSAAFDQSFNSQMFTQQGFDSTQMFPQQHAQHQQQPHHQHQQLVPPSLLIHKDSGIGGSENSPVPGMMGQSESHLQPSAGAFEQKQAMWPENPSLEQYVKVLPAAWETSDRSRFRYHVTLNAPTAMVRSQAEVPITYLNKGQAYTLAILDSLPVAPPPRQVRYRTTVRISFEDDEQRARPGQCWQLWKEGRGLAEAHQRAGKLQAVEYVDPHPGAAEDDPRKPRITVEKESFDGFAVTWSPAAHATSPNAECAIAVRFNFLSTDFSHSKGVKGIPVRLCAKTHMLVEDSENEEEDPMLMREAINCKSSEQPADAEVAYCKVKLFRDHGAERKLTNDIAHVKKSIDKLKSQIQQMESGIKEPGRRKRTSMSLGKIDSDRPNKVPKHKRTWSVSSTGSGGIGAGAVGSSSKGSIEEDLNEKLTGLQEMFTSTRPVSVLFLRGDEEDDMDKYPVVLAGEGDNVAQSGRYSTRDHGESDERSQSGSTLASPVAVSKPLPKSSVETGPSSFTVPAVPTKMQRGSISIEAIEINPSYNPPMPDIDRAVASVFVRRKEEDVYYKAIYLWSRTCEELATRISQKFGIFPGRIQQWLRVTNTGIEVELDDEMVEQLDEGQDMLLSLQNADGTIKVENQASFSRLADDVEPLMLRLHY